MEDTIANQTNLHNLSLIGHPPIEVYGIFGIMDLPTGPYLILISKADIIGELLNCQVFQVQNLLFIPLSNPVAPFSINPKDSPFV